ncbi:tetratricopeptide repeat protein [Aerophototrophica crusticola]|uniref:Tetratricopeptide repeat protein n=1 Tax=Aerophototrophica crusticola TaxID=1709002 RepID=A0A858R6V1_9PROT|nr:tetratricopeptide repeat protein [Rhodospirillaceae bacterium B3]
MAFYRQALSAAPDLPEVWHNLGNALSGLDRHEEAIEAYRRALSLDPFNRDTHANLNKLLWQLGRHGEVLESYRAAKRAAPDRADVLEMAAEAEAHFGRPEEALADVDRALVLAPDSPAVRHTRGNVLLRQDRPAEALADFERGLAAASDSAALLRGAGEAALAAGDPDKALAYARRLATLAPTDQLAYAQQALALRLKGDAGEAYINDYDRLVGVLDLPPPPGFADMEAFNRDLLAALQTLHTTKHEPIDQTLRHGTQTAETLFGRQGLPPVVGVLQRSLEQAITGWIATLPDDKAHPFLGRKTGGIRISGSWSARLHDQGYHTDHVHPAGWLSACYYAEVPDAVADEKAKQGWIKFGEPNMGPRLRLPWVRAVQPRPGRLVIFPSYVWHGTIPFHGPQHRTTVAFDMVPA